MNPETEGKAGHTPTPWAVVEGKLFGMPGVHKIVALNEYGENDGEVAISTLADDAMAKANAAFICKAVNAHEELVEACKAILTNNVLVLFPEDEAKVRKAIAKAEAAQ